MKIINKMKKIEELESGKCYLFHGRIYMKIDLKIPDSTEDESMCYVVDPANGHCLAVDGETPVKVIDPSLSY